MQCLAICRCGEGSCGPGCRRRSSTGRGEPTPADLSRQKVSQAHRDELGSYANDRLERREQALPSLADLVLRAGGLQGTRVLVEEADHVTTANIPDEQK